MSLLGQSRHIQRTPKTNFVRYAPNSDANVIRIIRAKWKIWIVRGAGSKKLAPTDIRNSFQGKSAPDRHSGGTKIRRTLPKKEDQRDTSPLWQR
jgi:hypothetical protein